MRIALLAPLPPEKNGIADYANHYVEIVTILSLIHI